MDKVREALEPLARICAAHEALFNGNLSANASVLVPMSDLRRASAALASLPASDAGGWRPIESAPRIPYAPLDLWVVPGKPLNNLPRAAPYREANATSSGNGKHWLTSKGRYLEGRRYYDDEGDECLDLEDRSADATIVTHWRPLPGAPVERARFTTKRGAVRYVVEHEAEGGGSFCHIYSGANLRLRAGGDDGH